MAREDRSASDITAGPAVPAPRQQASGEADPGRDDAGQADTGQADTGQGDTGRHDPERPEGADAPSRARESADHVLQSTRLSGTWLAVGCFLVLLVILLIFIAQNDTHVSISFLGTHTDVYLGVALVLAAVVGALLVMFAGMARIMQLRARARKHRRTAHKAARQRKAAP